MGPILEEHSGWAACRDNDFKWVSKAKQDKCAGMANGVVWMHHGFWVQLQSWADQEHSERVNEAAGKWRIAGG